MQILTIANQKGGTAKTTTAAAIAQAAAAQGFKVLAIDLDPQANYTFALKASTQTAGAYDLLEGTAARNTIQKTSINNIDVIASSKNLATVTTSKGSANRLKNALQPIKNIYDYIVIDTPPTASELLFNALQASTGLIIPLQADTFGLQGLYQIADTARQVQRSNPALQIKGYVLTRHNDRSNLTRILADKIQEQAEQLNIKKLAEIREGIAIKEAIALQLSMFEYNPKAKPIQDYMNLFDEIRKD